MILDIATIGICGGAGFLFLRGFYHAGGLTRMIADQPRRRTFAEPLPAPRFDPDAHELALFRDTGAWWLDPNRWGDQPKPLCEKHGTWRNEKGVCSACPTPAPVFALPKPKSPPCPRCGPDAPMIVMAEYGGVVSMWSCCVCGSDWTQKGKAGWIESKLSRRRREKKLAADRRADMMRFEQGLDTPHDMMRRDTDQAVEAWLRPPGGLR